MNMGKILRGITVVVMALGLSLPTQSEAFTSQNLSAMITIGSTTASANGKTIRLSVAPETKNGKAFIHSVDFGKLMDIRFPWSPGNRIANGYDALTDTTITLKADSIMATIDGDQFRASDAPYIKKVGRDSFFMIPMRFVCHVFGCVITASGKSIRIDKPTKLQDSAWVVPEGGYGRSYSVPNGNAPKGGKLDEDWGFKNGHEESGLLFFDGKVLSNDKRGWACFDANSKKLLWNKDCDEASQAGCELYPSEQLSCLDGKVFSGTGPKAFDANTGEILWKLDETNSDCAAFDGVVLATRTIPSNDETKDDASDIDLCCFQASDGKKLWSINLKKDAINKPTGLRQVVDGNGRFLLGWKVYETKTGKHLYDLPSETTDNKRQIQYVSSTDCFLVTNGKGMKIYNSRTGILQAERPIPPSGNIAIKNDRLYMIDENGKLTALGAKKLDVLWSSRMDPDAAGVLAISGYQAICANFKFISGYGLGTGKMLWKTDVSRFISGHKGLEMALADKSVYITAWLPFQKFTTRFSITH